METASIHHRKIQGCSVTDAEGRPIRLTFGQMAWAISVLVVLVGQWIRFEVRLNVLEKSVSEQHSYTRSEVDLMMAQRDARYEYLTQRVDKMEGRTTK